MRPQVDDRCHHKGQDHNRDLGIGIRSEQQHGKDHDDNKNEYGYHLSRNARSKAEANVGVAGYISVCKQSLDPGIGRFALFRIHLPGESHVVESIAVYIVGLGQIKLDHGDICDRSNLLGNLTGFRL